MFNRHGSVHTKGNGFVSGLKQHTHVMSQFLWVWRPALVVWVLCSGSAWLQSTCGLGWVFIQKLREEESASMFTQVTGRIYFLAPSGLRAQATCWLEAGDYPQLFRGSLGSMRWPPVPSHVGFPSAAAYLLKPARRAFPVSLLAR